MSVDGDEYQFIDCCDVLAFDPPICAECKGPVCKAHSTTPDENDPDVRVHTEACLAEWNSRAAERQYYATHDMGGSEGQR